MTTPKKPYSQSKALWAITKASFKAIFAHPSAIIFSILFPIIFTLIFGAFGSGGATTYRIAIENGSDTSNAFFQFLKNVKVIRIVPFTDTTELNKELIKGRLTAVLRIKENKDSSGQASYTLNTRTTTASNNSIMAFRQILEYMKLSYEKKATGAIPDLVVIPETDIKEVRIFNALRHCIYFLWNERATGVETFLCLTRKSYQYCFRHRSKPLILSIIERNCVDPVWTFLDELYTGQWCHDIH
jgi:ABC-2 type transport system permease protein